MPIVILGAAPDTPGKVTRKRLTKLLRVGGKLAVLGVEDGPLAMARWHVAHANSQSEGMMQCGTDGEMLHYARSLCGRQIVTNGYASDFAPPDGLLCPACRERL